jgi:hypothetical protein
MVLTLARILHILMGFDNRTVVHDSLKTLQEGLIIALRRQAKCASGVRPFFTQLQTVAVL